MTGALFACFLIGFVLFMCELSVRGINCLLVFQRILQNCITTTNYKPIIGQLIDFL